MFPRIVSDAAILGGKPCVKGTRYTVEFILELLASGGTRAVIASTYPPLTEQDVEEAVRFAAASLKNDVTLTKRAAG